MLANGLLFFGVRLISNSSLSVGTLDHDIASGNV